jgi:hypothetical protein
MLAMDTNILAGLFDKASLPLSKGAIGKGIELRLAATNAPTIDAGGECGSMSSSASGGNAWLEVSIPHTVSA